MRGGLDSVMGSPSRAPASWSMKRWYCSRRYLKILVHYLKSETIKGWGMLILRSRHMSGKPSIVLCLAALLLILPAVLSSQSSSQKHKLIIKGGSTEVPLIQVNGHAYVGLEALADVFKGSLSSSGKMIAL